MKKLIYILFLIFAFYSCDIFESHPYDGRITGETGINTKNKELIGQICAEKPTYKFAFISDTQRWFDETEDIISDINKRTDIDFVIHGGDLTDFGLTKEFLWMRDLLNRLNPPYITLLGNHDCLANGEEIFTKVFGESNFSFIVGDVKFVCLNTNALEYDYSRPVPDFQFIENQFYEDQDKFKRTIFAMHVRPYSEQFNNNVAKVFQKAIKEFPNLMFCINGHDHNLNINDVFDDGVIYYGVPSAKRKEYLIFTITPTDYSYEVIKI